MGLGVGRSMLAVSAEFLLMLVAAIEGADFSEYMDLPESRLLAMLKVSSVGLSAMCGSVLRKAGLVKNIFDCRISASKEDEILGSVGNGGTSSTTSSATSSSAFREPKVVRSVLDAIVVGRDDSQFSSSSAVSSSVSSLKPFSYMHITSSILGSSALTSRDVRELSLVKTLLRSVMVVPGAVEVVICDLKLERKSSLNLLGDGAPLGRLDMELSTRRLPKVDRVAGGLVGFR